MNDLDRMAWEVLNATADDWENLEQIYRSIALEFSSEGYEERDRGAYYWRTASGAATLAEIAERVRGLVEEGLLAARLEDDNAAPGLTDRSYVWRAWFRMSPEGRRAWEESEHANLV